MAHRGERAGVAARARQEEVYLHGKSLRAHYAREEIQGHENSHKGLRNDRRRSRRPNGLLPFSAAAELSLQQGTAQRHRKSARSSRRNVVEFRHASWWNEEVYSAFRKAGIIFCSCSAPRLPDELIRTAEEVYVRLHGPKRWYRHDYSNEELAHWATKIRDSGAKKAWVYFNNDFDAYAPKNAAVIRRTLQRTKVFR
jgi:hypothetical protein